MHLVRTQAACIFFSFPLTNPMWFQPNISQPQMGISQPQSININHKQSQTTIRYQSISIIHGLWMGGVYVYLYIAVHFYFNTYIIFTMHIQFIHRTYDLYKRCTTLI